MNQFEENLARLAPRWPDLAETLQYAPVESLTVELVEGRQSTLLVQGIQLSSRHDRHAEARWQAEQVAADAAHIHLYGTALGEIVEVLLARPALQQLTVHLLNETLFSLLLRLMPCAWLDDVRVSLRLASGEREVFKPFIALPGELALVSDANARIRDRLVAEIEWPYVSARLQDSATLRNERLQQNRATWLADRDVRELFASRQGEPVVVVASGPSQAGQHARLRSLQAQGLCPFVICLDTAWVPLRLQGIKPDLVVSIDINIHPGILPAEGSEGTPLVYFPQLQPTVLTQWRGPRFVACSESDFYASVRAERSPGTLFTCGSVLHPAVDLAVQMGASQVLLVGADFAFLDGETHTGWPAGQLTPAHMAMHWVLNGHGERVPTLLNFRSYLCYLEQYIARHPGVRFSNTSRRGAAIEGTDYPEEWMV